MPVAKAETRSFSIFSARSIYDMMHRMRISPLTVLASSFFCAACFFILSPAAASEAGTSAVGAKDEVIQTVENHYRNTNDLTAGVVQKTALKTLGKTQKFDGTLKIKKPGKLRLEYSNGQLVVIDGKTALFYSKKSEQVIKKAFTDFAHMNIPVSFLLGAAHIRDDFSVHLPDAKTPRMLELVPLKQGAAMKKLTMQTDETGRILQMTIFDKSGNVTEIQFTDVRENIGIDDQAFVFKAPRGTEIIEQ